MFSEIIKECVLNLRAIYKGRRNCVLMNFPIIEILKYSKDKELSIKLFYYPNSGTFEIQPADSKFCSKISYFDFSRSERRWTRDKRFLFSTISELKQCGLWELISNKDFLGINYNNEKVSEIDRSELLKSILN